MWSDVSALMGPQLQSELIATAGVQMTAHPKQSHLLVLLVQYLFSQADMALL